MDRTTAKACFSRLMKRHDTPRWRRAVSWLYHCEDEIEVIETFDLSTAAFQAAKEADNILHMMVADHNRVHEWSLKTHEEGA